MSRRTELIARGLEHLRRAKLMEVEGLTEILDAVFRLQGEGDGGHAGEISGGDCYLSTKELAMRIPYAEKTIRNLVASGELVEGNHYFRRHHGRRLIFSWVAMHEWVERNGSSVVNGGIPLVRNRKGARSQ